MRIALITRRYPPLIGGAERVLSYLAEAFARQGAQVWVLTSQTVPPTPPAAAHEADSYPRIVRLPTSRLRFLGTWMYMKNLEKRLDDHAIDIAYISMLKHDAYVAVDVGRKLGFPVVLRPEGAGITGDLAWQGWGRFGKKIAARCRRADAFVSISDAITRELVAAGYHQAKIHSLPNGVPVPSIAWSPRDSGNEHPHAVYVGRLAIEKNLETLIEAWRLVRSAHPKARLTLVGDGPLESFLERRIAALGMVGSVVFEGSVARPEEILRQADLFVLASNEEGMSIALLEAMALGMPVVASAIPGNRAILSDRVHGLLADPKSAQSLADAILEQASKPAEAWSRGQEARKHVESNYSIDAVARRHLELFEKLIEPKRI